MPEPNSALPSRIATLLPYLAAAIVVAVCYFSVAWLGLTFAIPPGNATVVWPASGIAVGALYLFGYRLWPAVWTGSCLVNLTTGVSFGVASSFATGNTIEAVVAVLLLRRFLPDDAFRGARDAFIFFLIAITSCVPAATVGALSMLLGGRIDADAFGANWITWLLGDLAGEVIIFPLLVALAKRRWMPITVARLFELLLLFGVQVVLSFFLFGGLLPERLAEQVLYLPMVLLIWCSLRFGLVEVTAGTILFSTAAILGAWAGVGAYGSNAPHEMLFDLQTLLFTYAMTSLVVSSIVSGQREAQSSSRKSRAELRRQTAERRRLEAWFRQLLTASPDALVVSDSDGQILLVNEAAEKLFGYSKSEMIGQTVEMLVPDRYRIMHREQRARYAESPYLRLMGSGAELTACRKDGSEFAAEIALGPTNTDDGLVVFSAVRDITSRKQAEMALKNSEERFALAVEGTDAGIWDWDLRTDDVYFSPRWKSMLGYAEDEIRHDFAEWESRLHPEDRERALRAVREYLDGNSPDFELEHRLRHKNGSYRWILARGAVVCNDAGKPYRMAGSHLDITDRKTMEERLRVQLAQLIAAAEMQSQLLPEKSPEIPGFDIGGKCYPAEFAAGDHFDFLELKDGTFVAVVGDVSGHGVGPAILMACLHAYLRSLADVYTDLSELVMQANNLIEEESPDQHFVTLLAGMFDTATRTLTYVCCGHPPGFIMNAEGEVTAWLKEGGLPLGILSNSQFPCSAPLQLHSGDVVVMLTDGVLEAFSPDGVQFGKDRTVRFVSEHRDQPAAQIIEALREAVDEYTERAKLTDDLTIVVIKVE